MTTLRKLVSEIDFNNKQLETSPSFESLGNLFDFREYVWTEEERLRCFFINPHYCTDTWVGIRAYFLDEELICLSSQNAIKSDEDFEFVSNELAAKLKSYLITLLKEENDEIDILDDFDVEIPDTYGVEYNTQILHKTAILDGVEVDIIKSRYPYDKDDSFNYFHGVLINNGGKEVIVDCRDLKFKYNNIS